MKKLLTLFVLTTLTATAQIQLLDGTTPHTNFTTTAANLNVPSKGWTNVPYSTTNYLYLTFGDGLPAAATTKLNSNLVYLTNQLGQALQLPTQFNNNWQTALGTQSNRINVVIANQSTISNNLASTMSTVAGITNYSVAATNGLGSAAFTSTTNYDAAGKAQAATNGLGSAAFTSTTNYDAAGTAVATTNGLGTAAFTASTAYDAAGKAQAATNGLGTAAFTASTAYDAAGKAQSATNGLGSAAFTSTTNYDAAGTAVAATNRLGTAAFTSTTNYDAAGKAQAATNGLGTAAFTASSTYLPIGNLTNTYGSLPIYAGSLQTTGSVLAAQNILAAVYLQGSALQLYDTSGFTFRTISELGNNTIFPGGIIVNGTNGLGTAAFTSTTNYDAAGTAQTATNGLETTAFMPLSKFYGSAIGMGLPSSLYTTSGDPFIALDPLKNAYFYNPATSNVVAELNSTATNWYGNFIGIGSSLTALNASSLSTGSVPDAQISATWAKKVDVTNTIAFGHLTNYFFIPPQQLNNYWNGAYITQTIPYTWSAPAGSTFPTAFPIMPPGPYAGIVWNGNSAVSGHTNFVFSVSFWSTNTIITPTMSASCRINDLTSTNYSAISITIPSYSVIASNVNTCIFGLSLPVSFTNAVITFLWGCNGNALPGNIWIMGIKGYDY